MNNVIVRTKTTFLLLLISFCAFVLPDWYLPALFSVALCWTLCIEWPQLCATDRVLILLTPIYPILPYVLLIFLSTRPERLLLIGSLLFIVGLFDSGSYFCGNLFGRTPLYPAISPKKTVEGAFGGAISALIGAFILYRYVYAIFPVVFPLYSFHVLMLCVSALLGDLFESWLKRRARLKDAGDLLPGHGGLLDRLDGIFGAVIYLTFVISF